MRDYIQKRIGIGVAAVAFLLAIIQLVNSYYNVHESFVDSLLEPSVLYVSLTGIIVLLTGFFRNQATRMIQVIAALLTGYATSFDASSGDLTYMIFLGLGAALALEYGFLEYRFTMKILMLAGILLVTLTFGMFVLHSQSYLIIIHSLLGAGLAIYLFYILTSVRIHRYKEQAEHLEKEVALRTRDLRREMETIRQLKNDLQSSLEEKEILLKEVLHRTKNNMQLISSFLNLELNNTEQVQETRALEKSNNRIITLALAHELLYRSENITRIDLKDYLEKLISDLWSDIPRNNISIETDVPEDIPTDLDFAIHLGLIINELLNNTYTHAFPSDRKGRVTVKVDLSGDTLTILFKDDGVGIAPDIQPETMTTLGIPLVLDLLRQYNGIHSLSTDNGTQWTMNIPFDRERGSAL